MAGFDALVIGAGIVAVVVCWAHSQWQARHVLRKLSHKGRKARKKAWKRLSPGERLIVERHHLRMLKVFAVAFSIALGGALVQGSIGFHADLLVLNWSGDVTVAENPAGYWMLWLAGSLIPIGLWGLYFRERRALDLRATRAAGRGDADPPEGESPLSVPTAR